MHTFATLTRVFRAVCAGRLSAADCRLLVCARLLQALALAAVACTGLPAARRALARIRPWAIALGGRSAEGRVIWAIEASARWRAGTSSCLARALAAELLLPPGDRPHTVVIGVAAPADGRLAAHAWIEREGRVLLGGSESRRQYVPLIAWNGGAA